MIDRRQFWLVLAWVCMTGASMMGAGFAQQRSDPRAIVEQIYKISAGPDGQYHGKSVFQLPEPRRRLLTKSLNGALDAMDRKSKRLNEPILDFDPITDSQDPSARNLTLATQSATARQAVVVAKFFAQDETQPTQVRYVLLLEGGTWKVDDISGGRAGQAGWSLRKVIR